MRRAWRFLWRWSWVLTLPVAAFFVCWLVGFAGRYADFQLRYDVAPHRFGWLFEGRSHAAQQWRRLRASLLPLANPDGLPVVSLFVGGDELARLHRELPHSGFEPVDGRLFDGRSSLRVDVRYRGDFFYHWAFEKKSLRVQTRRAERYRGLRTFNLTAPKFAGQVNDLLGYVLAGHLGLMAPHAELVWVYRNGDCRGLHLLLEQIGESTLRDRGRMPGDVYVGELVAKDAWLGLDNRLFDHPGLWEKVAVNNHFDPAARRPLERLCELLAAPPGEDVHRELGELLHVPSFARLAALEILIGNYHTGESHNWRLYWDPWRTRFEPIVWDPCAYGGFEQWGPAPPVGLDPNVSRLHNLLLANAEFLAARQAALREFLGSGAEDAYLAGLERAIGHGGFAAAHDPLLLPADPGHVRSVLQRLPAHVRRIHDAVRRAYVEEREPVQWSAPAAECLRVAVADRVPVTALELRFDRPLDRLPEATLHIGRTGAAALQRRLPAALLDGGRRLRLDVTLHAQLQPAPRVEQGWLKVLSHRVLPTSYEIGLEDLPENAALIAVDAERAGGDREPARRAAALPATPLDLLYGMAPETAPPVRWRGTVAVEGTLEVPGELWIEPGTVVQMAPGASVLVRGRCTAAGTAAAPVRVVRAEPEEPWGTFALVGRGADGSSLAHAVFEGGSGLVDPHAMFEYSGMVSIHDVQDVHFAHCRFVGGRVVDDMVHAVYAGLDWEDCEFRDCTADAVDLDITRARLLRCTFARTGNDGLDLMTSSVLADQCRFEDCGDKGISVGEGSRLLSLGGAFSRCTIGVQAKDGSQAAVAGARFEDCGQALDAYWKNWRYRGGGTLAAWGCAFRGNARPPAADASSRIAIGAADAEPELAAAPQVELADGPPPALGWLLELDPDAPRRWAAAGSGADDR